METERNAREMEARCSELKAEREELTEEKQVATAQMMLTHGTMEQYKACAAMVADVAGCQ